MGRSNSYPLLSASWSFQQLFGWRHSPTWSFFCHGNKSIHMNLTPDWTLWDRQVLCIFWHLRGRVLLLAWVSLDQYDINGTFGVTEKCRVKVHIKVPSHNLYYSGFAFIAYNHRSQNSMCLYMCLLYHVSWSYSFPHLLAFILCSCNLPHRWKARKISWN